MKIFSKILLTLGVLFFLVGIIFYYYELPDLWNGIITGPIVIVIALLIRFMTLRK